MIEFFAGIAMGACGVIALAYVKRNEQAAPPAPTTPTRAQLEAAIRIAQTNLRILESRNQFDPSGAKQAGKALKRMEQALAVPASAEDQNAALQEVK